MKISTKNIIIFDKYGLRLNFPNAKGIFRKIDKFVFKYSNSKKIGLPCFLTTPKIRKQLVIDGKPVYSGGGVNCWNEPLDIYPVTVNKEQLMNCLKVARKGTFRVRNFEYNGFMGKLLEGYTKLNPKIEDLVLTNDPGIYKFGDNYIPSYAIEGIEILFKVKETNKIPNLFGAS